MTMPRLAAAFLLFLMPGVLLAQADTTATLPRAFQLVQARQFAEARSVLEKLVERNREDGRAWSLLGTTRFRLRDYPGALTAYQEAMRIDSSRPAALYNTGLLFGAMGKVDSAFHYLFLAKQSNRFDLTQIGADSDAVVLRKDPRFKQLFPTAEEYADPFVEPAVVVRDWHGEAQGDQFGWIARNAGDLDGDRINDVVTSAPSHATGGQNAGRVYAYSTRTGRLLWSRDGGPGHQLGTSVEAAGDVDRDGIPDIIAGAPGGGLAQVFSGRDGRTLLTLTGEDSTHGFGGGVSDVGDVNGDGHADLLVGAPGVPGAEFAGAAYLYSGKDGTIIQRFQGEQPGNSFGSTVGGGTDAKTAWLVIGAGGAGPQGTGRTYVYRAGEEHPAFIIDSDSSGGALGGMFVSVVGDVDRDGVADIYASDWSNRAKGRSTGRIYVYSGRTGQPIHVLTGENAGDGFGIGVADLGDINRDGHADLVIGAWQFAGAAPSGGKVYIYSGRDGALLRSLTGKVPGETLGFDATGLGDVTGDGVPDLLLTSAWSGIRGTRSGRVLVVSGATIP